MRQAARVDANQAEMVKTLRAAGMTVQVLSAVGKGCPDLLVGWRGLNVLIEGKDGAKTPGNRPLTQDEAEWHATWGGQVDVALSPKDAVDHVMHHVLKYTEALREYDKQRAEAK